MGKRNSFLREFLEIIGSVRLGIVLLVVLTVVSLLGTVILQRPGTHGQSADLVDYYGEGQYKLLAGFGLTDVFHTPWFHALLALFAANILCATIVNFSLRPEKLGFLLAHAGVLLVLVGGAVYRFSGDKGTVLLRRGETTRTYRSERTRNDRPLGFAMTLDRFDTELYPGEVVLWGPMGNQITVKPTARQTMTLPWDAETSVTFEQLIRNARPSAAPAAGTGRLLDPIVRLALKTPRGQKDVWRLALGANPADYPVIGDGTVAAAFGVEDPGGLAVIPTEPRLYVINTAAELINEVPVREGESFELPGVDPKVVAKTVSVTEADPQGLGRGPGLRVEIEADGKKEYRGVWASLPRYNLGRQFGVPGRFADIDFVYYRPETVLHVVRTESGAYELRSWRQAVGKWESRSVELGRSVTVGPVETTLLEVVEWKYEPAEKHTGIDATLVDVRTSNVRSDRFWISTSPSDPVRRLSNDFKIAYDASPHVREYRGFITLDDNATEPTRTVVRVNHPADYHGTQVFLHTPGRVVALRISRDPGLTVVTIGLVILTVGIFTTCFIKPILTRRRHSG